MFLGEGDKINFGRYFVMHEFFLGTEILSVDTNLFHCFQFFGIFINSCSFLDEAVNSNFNVLFHMS